MREIIRDQLNRSVPFASHTGIAIDEIRDGEAIASLEQSDVTINHIGTQHAGALFTLGQAASGPWQRMRQSRTHALPRVPLRLVLRFQIKLPAYVTRSMR